MIKVCCDNCGREITKNNLTRHYATCTGQPSKAWNAGLTVSDPRVKKNTDNMQKTMKTKKGRPHTEATKKKLSEIRKKFLKDNPDKVPYLQNHSSKQSYPEAYFSKCLENTGLFSEFRVKTYRLDFANPSMKRYLEIDGEQHYNDPRIVKHDKIRTKVLSELGWVGMRVRWSEFSKLSFEAKSQKVKEIIIFMVGAVGLEPTPH